MDQNQALAQFKQPEACSATMSQLSPENACTQDGPRLKAIPDKFVKLDFEHELVKRAGDVCIYRRKHRDVSVWHFEVVVLGQVKEREAFGKTLAGGEQYPSSEDWGSRGWTYPTLEAALVRFERCVKEAAE